MELYTFRKYVAVCKRKNPVVDDQLRERLVSMYVDLRKEARESDDSTFTSPRLLLSVIRFVSFTVIKFVNFPECPPRWLELG